MLESESWSSYLILRGFKYKVEMIRKIPPPKWYKDFYLVEATEHCKAMFTKLGAQQ